MDFNPFYIYSDLKKCKIGFKNLAFVQGQGVALFKSGAYNRGWKPLPQLC
jgi:hypothetical protein